MDVHAVFGPAGTAFTVNGIAQFMPQTQFVFFRGETVIEGPVTVIKVRGPVDADTRDARFSRIESGLRVAGLVADMVGARGARQGISTVNNLLSQVKG